MTTDRICVGAPSRARVSTSKRPDDCRRPGCPEKDKPIPANQTEEEYFIESVMGRRQKGKGFDYLVKWDGECLIRQIRISDSDSLLI